MPLEGSSVRKGRKMLVVQWGLLVAALNEGPEGVKWKQGLACFCPGKM